MATLRAVAEALGEGWGQLSQIADQIEGAERLNNAVGQRFEVNGTTVNGDKFEINVFPFEMAVTAVRPVGQSKHNEDKPLCFFTLT